MNIAELFARIGLKDEASKGIESVKKGLVNAAKGAAVFVAGVEAIGASLVGLAIKSSESAQQLKQLELVTGESGTTLQQWRQIGLQAGISADSLSNAISTLAKNREKIKLGEGNISGYQLLGIDPMANPVTIIQQLREKMSGLAPAMQANMLSQLGLSEDLLNITNLTSQQIAAMKANTFVVPQSAINSLTVMRGNFLQLGNVISWFTSLIGAKLAPVINKVVKEIINWIRENKEGLLDGIKNVFEFVVKFTEALGTFIQVINDLVTSTIGWKNGLFALVAALAILNRGLLASPLTWYIAGIMALISVLDDLYHYNKGDKKSLFGELVKNNKDLKPIVDGIVNTLKTLKRVLADLFTGNIADFDRMMNQWGIFGQVLKVVYATLITIKQVLHDLFTLNFSHFYDEFTQTAEKLGLSDQQIMDKIGVMFGGKRTTEDAGEIADHMRKIAEQQAAGAPKSNNTPNIEIKNYMDVNPLTGESHAVTDVYQDGKLVKHTVDQRVATQGR